MNTQSEIHRPTLILVRGLPGSGKSHLTKALQAAFGSTPIVTLDPDATDYESKDYKAHVKALTAEGVDPKLHAYRFLRAQAYEGITSGKIIVWNQPFTNLDIFNKMVAGLRQYAADHHVELPVLVVEVEISPETARKRVLERKSAGGHGPSDNTFDRFTNDYASFARAGYNVVTVHGEDPPTISIEKIMLALKTTSN